MRRRRHFCQMTQLISKTSPTQMHIREQHVATANRVATATITSAAAATSGRPSFPIARSELNTGPRKSAAPCVVHNANIVVRTRTATGTGTAVATCTSTGHDAQ